jgi:hypothetical protein
MKKISEPEDDIKRFEPENSEGSEENGSSALFLITLILSIALDTYDIIPAILTIAPGIETVMSLIVFPFEGLNALTFWLYSKEKAKRAKFLVNLLRSSYFIEMLADFIPEAGRIIDLLPLRTISITASLFIAKGEEIIEKPFKTIK